MHVFFLLSADFFSKLTYFFRNMIRVSISLDPDQACCDVGPDQDPTVFKCYQQLKSFMQVYLITWCRLFV